MKKTLLLSACVLSLTACETFTADRYVASDKNKYYVEETKSKVKFDVSDFSFSDPEALSVTCRMAGPIQVAGGSYEKYFQDALASELQNAGIFKMGTNKKISVVFDEIRVTSVTPASWDIVGTFYINDKKVETVETSYGYKTSYSALNACNNAAENLPYAAEDFFTTFLTGRSFRNELVH